MCMWCERLTLKRRVQVAATAFVLAFLAILPSSAADISYVYDDAGRLRAVIDPATNTAIYAYDAVGNLTGITQQAASTLVLLQATPASDPVGTTVTIYGTGFSATPASNTVKLNGTTATVLTASTDRHRAERRHHRVHQRHRGSEYGDQCGLLYGREWSPNALEFQPCRGELWRHRHPHWDELRHDPHQ